MGFVLASTKCFFHFLVVLFSPILFPRFTHLQGCTAYFWGISRTVFMIRMDWFGVYIQDACLVWRLGKMDRTGQIQKGK